MVKACVCSHEYQDKKYGKGMRVHNPKKGGGSSCTVCGRTEGVATLKKTGK